MFDVEELSEMQRSAQVKLRDDRIAIFGFVERLLANKKILNKEMMNKEMALFLELLDNVERGSVLVAKLEMAAKNTGA